MWRGLTNIRWRICVLGGIKAPIFGTLLWIVLVVLYAIALAIAAQGPPDHEAIARFGTYGTWSMPALTIVTTRYVAATMARNAPADTEIHGAVLGALSGVGLLMAWMLAHGTPSLWTFVAALVCIGVGWRGGIAARIALARRQRQYRASRAIATADTIQGVVDGVGAYLGDTQIRHVSLWVPEQYDSDGTPLTIRHVATWQSNTGASPEMHMKHIAVSLLGDVQPEKPLLVAIPARTSHERTVWETMGFHHPIVLPLAGPDDRYAAMVMMDWTTVRAAKRAVNSIQSIATPALLALDNIRLLEQGRQVGVLEERQRLAREIHDTLAQGFTSIVMHLEAAEQSFTENAAAALDHLDLARRTARESLSEARHVVWALRPDVLAHSSLCEALERVAQQWSEDSHVLVAINITGRTRPLVVAIEATLLRVVQEALANVRKHAHARRVMITLSFMDDLVALDVRDDGVGFDTRQLQQGEYYRSSGYGLMAMRERVQECGGNMLVESVPGEGTTLAVEVPSIQSEHGTAGTGRQESQ